MSLENSFPPVDPVSPVEVPWIVVPRRRKFGQRSREKYNQLLQSQSDLSELTEPAPKTQPPDPLKNALHFNKLV